MVAFIKRTLHDVREWDCARVGRERVRIDSVDGSRHRRLVGDINGLITGQQAYMSSANWQPVKSCAT